MLNEILDSSILQELKRLELRTKRVVNSTLSGSYRSAFKGSGLIYSDIREYQPGDDIRRIHWKVTARTGRAHVKTFEEDRELNITLAVDFSRSTASFDNSLVAVEKKQSETTTLSRSNHLKALEFCAILSFLAKLNHDRIGLLLWADRIIESIPASSGRSQFIKLISRLLLKRELPAATSLTPTLEELVSARQKKGILFLISDFLCPIDQQLLKHAALKFDLIGVILANDYAKSLPDLGLIEFIDCENSERILFDTSDSKSRIALIKYEHDRVNSLTEIFRTCGAESTVIYDRALPAFKELISRRIR
jgi:uncharacterized protein (DUF58 family)